MSWKPLLSRAFPPFPDDEGVAPPLPRGGAHDSIPQKLAFRERVQKVCTTIALHGNALALVPSPWWSLVFYVAKALLYLAGFLVLCAKNDEPSARVLVRLLAYTSLWKSVGLGVGAGPAAGRYLPPALVSFFHFIYMGTAKFPLTQITSQLPPFIQFLQFQSTDTRRGILDVALFSLYLNFSAKLAFGGDSGDNTSLEQKIAMWLLSSLVLGISDQSFWLASRAHVLGSMMASVGLTLLLLVSSNQDVEAHRAVALIQVLVLAAGAVNKLGAWYEYAVPGVGPLLSHRVASSGVVARWLARASAAVDFTVIGVLAHSSAASLTVLCAMLMCSSVGGGGVSLEHNIFLLLTAASSSTTTTTTTSLLLALRQALLEQSTVVPVVVFPGSMMAMPSSWLVCAFIAAVHVVAPAYYYHRVHSTGQRPSALLLLLLQDGAAPLTAGNRPVSCWLFKRSALRKLDQLWTFSDLPHKQLSRLYLETSLEQYEYRALCGRLLMQQLNARALVELIPQAVAGNDVDEYLCVDGDLVAGTLLGCGGGGFIPDHHALVAEIQSRCDFAAGELRHIAVGSIVGAAAQWTIVDETCAVTSSGDFSLDQLKAMMQ